MHIRSGPRVSLEELPEVSCNVSQPECQLAVSGKVPLNCSLISLRGMLRAKDMGLSMG